MSAAQSELPPRGERATRAEIMQPPASDEAPTITLEITTTTILVSHGEELDDANGSASFDLRAILDGDRSDASGPLRSELARLRTRAAARPGADPEAEPRLIVRVADAVGTREVQEVLDRALRAGQREFTLEVQSPAGRRLVPLLPYTFCACRMPEGTTWCAAPQLRIDGAGVTLVGAADLTPPPGCHKTIPGVGQERPPFAEAIEWRERVIAGPGGGCPTALIDGRGVDGQALRERLRALQRAAPGCGWAALAVDGAVPWARVAEVLAAVHDTFGALRITFREPTPTPENECARALTIDALRPASEASAPLARRPGCREEPPLPEL